MTSMFSACVDELPLISNLAICTRFSYAQLNIPIRMSLTENGKSEQVF